MVLRYINHFLYLISLATILLMFIIHVKSLNKVTSTISVLLVLTGIAYEFFSLETKQDNKIARSAMSCLVVNLFFVIVSYAGFKGIMQTGSSILFYTGAQLTTIGLTIRILSKSKMDKLFTYSIETQTGHQLITDGVYSFIRHPSYLGSYLFSLGIICLFDFLPGLIFISIYIPFGAIRIKKEEKKLVEKFGGKYLEYKKNVPCILPFRLNKNQTLTTPGN